MTQFGGQRGGYNYHHQQHRDGRGGGNRPPNKRMKRGDDKGGWEPKGKSGPDMDHETWMKLNGYVFTKPIIDGV